MVTGPRIAFFHPYFGDGGVERGIVLLARRFASAGIGTDVVTLRPKRPIATDSVPGLRFLDLGAGRAITSIRPLRRYLRKERPACMVAAQSYANLIAIAANRLGPVLTRLVVTERVAVSKERLDYAGWMGFGRVKSRLILTLMRYLYPLSDVVAANSLDGADDLERVLGGAVRPAVLYNPTFDPEIAVLAGRPAGHPWIDSKSMPVIVGIGRLNRQKDFATLLKAFAEARREAACRLIVIGEGEERESLVALASRLGIASHVDFPGFMANPYSLLGRADLFVLSSLYEGLPNALIEAVALGVPAISTNCLSGPREILLDGDGGILVGVGDVRALAAAMREAIARPERAKSMAAKARLEAARFESAGSAERYLDVCLPESRMRKGIGETGPLTEAPAR